MTDRGMKWLLVCSALFQLALIAFNVMVALHSDGFGWANWAAATLIAFFAARSIGLVIVNADHEREIRDMRQRWAAIESRARIGAK